MRILAASVFERVVYHAYCLDDTDPANPRLEVDAVLRDGDADGPLLLHVADYKRMVGFEVAESCLPELRARDRTVVHDGVEYLVFRLWSPADDEPPAPAPPETPGRRGISSRGRRPPSG